MSNVIQLPTKPETQTIQLHMPREIQREVKTFYIECGCPNCADGRMMPKPFSAIIALMQETHGKDYMGNPTDFPHACTHCGHEETYKAQYPTLRYFYVDEMKG